MESLNHLYLKLEKRGRIIGRPNYKNLVNFSTNLDKPIHRWFDVKEGFPAEGIPVRGQDKTARLQLITPFLQLGRVLFPKKGCEVLIQQLIGFGPEKYDDLADAFAMLIGKAMKENEPKANSFPEQGNDAKSKPYFAGLLDRDF